MQLVAQRATDCETALDNPTKSCYSMDSNPLPTEIIVSKFGHLILGYVIGFIVCMLAFGINPFS